jgi:hypothetical protein
MYAWGLIHAKMRDIQEIMIVQAKAIAQQQLVIPATP